MGRPHFAEATRGAAHGKGAAAVFADDLLGDIQAEPRAFRVEAVGAADAG